MGNGHISFFLCETVVRGQHILFLLSSNPFVPFSVCWRSKVSSSCVRGKPLCVFAVYLSLGGILKGDCPLGNAQSVYLANVCASGILKSAYVYVGKKENLFIHIT